MNTEAQLERIGAICPPPAVRIYVLDSPGMVTGICMWLCAPCKARLEAQKWVVHSESDPPEVAGALPCQECPRSAA